MTRCGAISATPTSPPLEKMTRNDILFGIFFIIRLGQMIGKCRINLIPWDDDQFVSSAALALLASFFFSALERNELQLVMTLNVKSELGRGSMVGTTFFTPLFPSPPAVTVLPALRHVSKLLRINNGLL